MLNKRFIFKAKWFGDKKLCPRTSLRHEIIITTQEDLGDAYDQFVATTRDDSPAVGSGWTIERIYQDVTDDWHGLIEDRMRCAPDDDDDNDDKD